MQQSAVTKRKKRLIGFCIIKYFVSVTQKQFLIQLLASKTTVVISVVG